MPQYFTHAINLCVMNSCERKLNSLCFFKINMNKTSFRRGENFAFEGHASIFRSALGNKR